MSILIDDAVARKVLATVDAGLSSGLGKPVPGQMCVEAAVCFALGLPHSDDPMCVSPALRALKIALNDQQWSSNTIRAKGMRRLALAQLGSKGVLDDTQFVELVSEMTIKTVVPGVLRLAASLHTEEKHKQALEATAIRCETEGSEAASYAASAASYAASAASEAASAARAASYAARAASYAASAASEAASYAASYAARAASYAARAASYAARAASDEVLASFAESVVQILIEMKAPGCQYLHLT